ncbi:hypothetical protein C8C99_0305 [Acidovorax sp. 107]|uniref:hypothetical protein n=1 Tax=Acidovorax sp. 107 TaxID=2135638 RepID=UPI000D3BF366|nr:hypothetical protein [Acidovorax sp. 107]PUA95505.1 hypothetical protein C8C99_0305 [Acidovorax sp. 107]
MYQDDRRTIEESYASATASSDLRCDTREGAPRSDTDLLIAAGWSPSRIGAALLRLHTEWDGAEHLRPAAGADFAQAARARQPVALSQTPPMARAVADKLAAEFNHQQAKLLMSRLKTMPVVREQLTLQLLKWKVEDAEQVAGALLRWWLAPNCHACHGRKFEVIPDTGRLSSKHCKPCGATGKLRIPHGEAGRKLANFMDDCVHRARQSIKKRLHPAAGRV